ncbi:hypothetical protein Pden_4977 (plasmid) [Paracoccus denitrificans PD1222]|uniref:Uncharacterized protein n=1 Tax=Paracoccus denitrificans (strain Pd 1222) TaxID=318586 RepID=A1BBZ3_PARDP|nr:hypothetical protein Pden_4977 [Paracoccus denitrificans PD1222]
MLILLNDKVLQECPLQSKVAKPVKRHSYHSHVYQHVFGQTGRRAHIPTARKAAGNGPLRTRAISTKPVQTDRLQKIASGCFKR